MIIGMVFSVAGVMCSVLGMRCATIIPDESKHKRWVILAGGGSHLLAGKTQKASPIIDRVYSNGIQKIKIKTKHQVSSPFC